MRAFAVSEGNTVLSEMELPHTDPQGAEVLLWVSHSRVCHTDTHPGPEPCRSSTGGPHTDVVVVGDEVTAVRDRPISGSCSLLAAHLLVSEAVVVDAVDRGTTRAQQRQHRIDHDRRPGEVVVSLGEFVEPGCQRVGDQASGAGPRSGGLREGAVQPGGREPGDERLQLFPADQLLLCVRAVEDVDAPGIAGGGELAQQGEDRRQAGAPRGQHHVANAGAQPHVAVRQFQEDPLTRLQREQRTAARTARIPLRDELHGVRSGRAGHRVAAPHVTTEFDDRVLARPVHAGGVEPEPEPADVRPELLGREQLGPVITGGAFLGRPGAEHLDDEVGAGRGLTDQGTPPPRVARVDRGRVRIEQLHLTLEQGDLAGAAASPPALERQPHPRPVGGAEDPLAGADRELQVGSGDADAARAAVGVRPTFR